MEIILLDEETNTPSLYNVTDRSVHDKSNVINDIPSLCNSINRIDALYPRDPNLTSWS